MAVPGRTTRRTPTKPTMMAAQRLRPAHSPRIGPDKAVTSMGEARKIVAVSASCRCWSAAKLNAVDTGKRIPRNTCKPHWLTENTSRGRLQARLISRKTTAWVVNRAQTTKIGTRPASTRYFAVVSINPNNRKVPSAMRIATGGMPSSSMSRRLGIVFSGLATAGSCVSSCLCPCACRHCLVKGCGGCRPVKPQKKLCGSMSTATRTEPRARGPAASIALM